MSDHNRGRILLVDDSRMDIEVMLDAFRAAGVACVVDVAAGGQKALDRLFGRGEFAAGDRPPLPDIVLLDLKMPVVDGFELLRQIKGAPVLKRIPVIVFSSSSHERDVARCYELGANSFLIKPVSFKSLLQVVKKIEDYWLGLNAGPAGSEGIA